MLAVSAIAGDADSDKEEIVEETDAAAMDGEDAEGDDVAYDAAFSCVINKSNRKRIANNK